MKFNNFFFTLSLFSLILLACAKPNYQDIQGSTPTGEAAPNTPENQKPQNSNCANYLPNSQICLHIQWLQKPNSQNNSSFTLSFTKENTNQPITAQTFEEIALSLKVLLWMPSMGHGSVPVIIKKNSETQSLIIERVYFIMPGDWEIRFQLKKNESIIDETNISLFI